MATWKKVLVSGSAIEVLNITASNIPEGTTGDFLIIDSEGRIAKTGSGGGGGGGIFINQGTFYDTENSLKVTGSTLQPAPNEDYNQTSSYASSYVSNNYAFIVSQSAYFDNHNVGHPNSLAWGSNLDGSIFNNYNATTDVSEILRALVGIISASNGQLVASPTPNSTLFAGANVNPEDKPSDPIANYWGNAFIPDNYTNPIALYLNSKGFNNGVGDDILGNVIGTKYSQSHDDFGLLLNSLPGSTYFDAGLVNTNFTVFAIASQSFSDTQSDTTPDENSTFTTSSFFQTTQNGAGTTNGVTVATIATGNPTVIPPQYQEAQFTNFPLITDRRYKASGEDFTSISASGYYAYHDIKVGIATGSTDVADIIGGSFTSATSVNGATSTYFITPLNPSDISDNSISISTGTADITTAFSRSLSGAPYLNSFYYYINNFTASGAFSPLFYGGSSTIATMSISDDIGTTHTTTVADLRARAQGGTIDSGYQNIYDSGFVFELSVGTTPYIDSKILFDGSLVIVNTKDYKSNVLESISPTNTSFDLSMIVRKYNGTTVSGGITKAYHTAGTFGQPAASGALHVFMSNDGNDVAPGNQTSTTSIEYFGGEGYRRPIQATTNLASSNAWDSGSRLTLGNGGDLQVKPGYLVNPESSTHGYWYPTAGYSNTHYKWYLREFDTGETGTANNLVLTFNSTTDIVPLSTTTVNKIGIGVLLEYQLNNLGGGNPKIYDVGNGYGGDNGDVSLSQSTSPQYNPFSDTADVTSNWGGVSDTSTTITLSLAAGAGQVINSTYSKIYLLVRYTGTPSNTLESIAVSTT